jgi:hypothetical protein
MSAYPETKVSVSAIALLLRFKLGGLEAILPSGIFDCYCFSIRGLPKRSVDLVLPHLRSFQFQSKPGSR